MTRSLPWCSRISPSSAIRPDWMPGGAGAAPDFVIEILSPATAAKDQIQKVALYEKHGVKEYWTGHPSDRLITVRLLEADGRYGIPKIYEAKGSCR